MLLLDLVLQDTLDEKQKTKKNSSLHTDNRSITCTRRLTHIRLCNTCQIAPLRAQTLDRCVHSWRVYRSHRPTCHLFIYIFNVTTCPSGIAVSQFPQWEDQAVGSGSSERWPLLGSQEAVLCTLDRQMLSAAEGNGARREGHSGPKSSICFYQLLFNACEKPLHPYLSLSLNLRLVLMHSPKIEKSAAVNTLSFILHSPLPLSHPLVLMG